MCQELSIKGAASNFARFFDVRAWDSKICYGCRLLSKYFGYLSNPLNCTYDCSFSLTKFLKTKVIEQLFEINYITRKIRWLCNVQHREGYIGHYWCQYSLMILHQETPEEVSFCESMDIMECKYMVIKLILEVQINYYFSLQCSSIIIKHVKFWKNSRQPSRVFFTRQ